MGPFSYETSFLFCVPYLGLLLSPVVLRPVSDSDSFPAGMYFTTIHSSTLPLPPQKSGMPSESPPQPHWRRTTARRRRCCRPLSLSLSLSVFPSRSSSAAPAPARDTAARARARPCACTSCSLLFFCLSVCLSVAEGKRTLRAR